MIQNILENSSNKSNGKRYKQNSNTKRGSGHRVKEKTIKLDSFSLQEVVVAKEEQVEGVNTDRIHGESG